MLKKFNSFIQEKSLFKKRERILLAVSGGIDSMVMSDLFLKADLNIGIAHCNFSLRDSESDADEQFVEKYAKDHDIHFYSKKFDTGAEADAGKISIQMAARELRYDWLECIREENGYHFIATAHHLNDSIETFIINFSRGTGISGLHGILPKNKKVVRPLLFATKEDIVDYAEKEKIIFREDSSNATDKYIRNHIRHNVILSMQKVHPSFMENALKTIEYLSQTEELVHQHTERIKRALFTYRKDEVSIPIAPLLALEPMGAYLFSLFKEYGINRETTHGLEEAIKHEKTGNIFHLERFELLVDREILLLYPQKKKKEIRLEIHKDTHRIETPVRITITYFNRKELKKIEKEEHIALLDADKLEYPLELRLWQKGDSFIPFGMKGHKKVSDFLVDKKISRRQKEQMFVITSAQNIIWLVGMRIDNRFAITDKTQNILKLEIKI